MNRKPIFDEMRALLGRGLTQSEVDSMDAAIDAAEGIVVIRPPKLKGRKITKKGERLIQEFEGCELEAYLDVAGIPTIGWGHTGPEVRMGQTITQEEADRLFDADTDRFEAAVERMAPNATDNQFDALVSFAYNVGEGDGGLATSTLLKKHKAGDFEGASREFARWNKARVNGKLLPVRGLTRRRAAEAELYRS